MLEGARYPRNAMTTDDLDGYNEWPVLPISWVTRSVHGFHRHAQPSIISCQEKSQPVCQLAAGSSSGNMIRSCDEDTGHVARGDVRPSRREIIRGMIERLSKPSKTRSIFGPELTEHAKMYGASMDLADAVALERRVDAKYAAREKAGKSKNLRNRRT